MSLKARFVVLTARIYQVITINKSVASVPYIPNNSPMTKELLPT